MEDDSDSIPTAETAGLLRLSDDSDDLESANASPFSVKPEPVQNPLPWRQLCVVFFARICDSLASQSIHPYINQLVGELDVVGGDKRKVGYYVGIIDSSYQVALALTMLPWNRLSDYTGRKPVLLTGIFGAGLSILLFGLSRTFLGLVMSRCLWGLLDGNVGVTKSIVGEITDSTNRARGFGLVFVLWAVGGTLGPLVGGILSRPSDRFPEVFIDDFWKRYPYFLPCLVVAMVIAISFVFTLVSFKETVSKNSIPFRREIDADDKPLPLRRILVYPVVVAISNYMALSFLGHAFGSLFSLFFTMPIDIGGLGFDPSRIGYILGAHRAIAAVVMGTGFHWLVRQMGERKLFIMSMLSHVLVWIVFPVLNLCARRFGIGVVVWAGVVLMVVPVVCMDLAHGCIYIFVVSSAPNKRSLGSTNGISQTSASVAKTIAPAMATSLFSFSVQYNLLGGYAVYVVMFVLSALMMLLALRLPHRPKPVWEESVDGEEGEEDEVDLMEMDSATRTSSSLVQKAARVD